MKTSNKLLIGLAALFFIIPLSAMIYDSKNYVDAKDFKNEAPKAKTFDEELKNNFAQPLSAFNSIKMADAKGMLFYFSFIKDAKYGVKISDQYKGLLAFKNGANGTLEISVVGAPQKNSTIEIMIYGPSANGININNAKRINMDGDFTSLEIVVSNVGSVALQDNEMDKLILKTDKVEELQFWEVKIKTFEATLNETDFNSNNSTYSSLTIKTSGKSDLSFGDNEKKETLGNASITTLGKGKIEFGKNVVATSVTGSLSDSTNVDMPVIYLKQLFKN